MERNRAPLATTALLDKFLPRLIMTPFIEPAKCRRVNFFPDIVRSSLRQAQDIASNITRDQCQLHTPSKTSQRY
jgi:hypothetical protein